ncbi:MAG TPA: hypothetical protein PK141_07905 [Polyangiaceae bacterium]|nr:hypothetical protein [Polyangiaceae bacterium]
MSDLREPTASNASTPPLTLEPKAAAVGAPPRGTARRARLTGLDWALTLVAGNTSVFLLGFSLVAGQRLGAMTSDPARLSWLTSLALRWYVPTGAGLAVGLLLLSGLFAPTTSGRRPRLVGAATAGTLLCGLCVLGLYLPILQLAGRATP